MQSDPAHPLSTEQGLPKPASSSETAQRGQRHKWSKVMEDIEKLRREQEEARRISPEVELLIQKKQNLEIQLEDTQHRLENREDKIRRMQESASWKMTAPLRALRRSFEKKPVETAGAAALQLNETNRDGRPDPRFIWTIDQPSRWEAAPATGSIRGWFLWIPQSTPAMSIRIRIGTKVVDARMGIERPDVVSAHKFDRDSALRCGFAFDYSLPLGDEFSIVLEALSEDGRWIRFLSKTMVTSRDMQSLRGYEEWLQANTLKGPALASALKARLHKVSPEKLPLISVIMPVYNSPQRWLERAIESVREQVYTNWELCIADDASTEPWVRPVLEKAAAQDPRIRVDFRLENGHISKASNSALELASGAFVALFDHDDELRPDALAEVALFLAQRPDCGLVYTDEDKIDTEGVRSDPYCKPDFLPDLIVGQNFCSHLSVFNTALVRELGGFREGLEGSQDWDLVLRVVERCGPERVGHVPKILYSWRRIAGSTAVSVGEKSYSVKAARRALQEHFDRLGIKAGLNMVQGCHWQVLYPLPEPRPLVSIIIPTHNNAGLLRTCVASLFSRTDYHPIELLIVNHQSDEKDSLDLLDELREEPNVRVFDFTDEFNYSAINNFAARHAQGEFLCLLNNDIEVLSPDWLSELLSHAQRPGVGAVGPMLYYPNRTIQHAGVLLGPGGVAAHAFCGLPASGEGYMNRARLTQNYSAVTGACLLVRRSLFEQVGGLNEKELAVAFNDIDFCLKLRKAGCRNVWTPFAQLIHHESATRGLEDTPEKQERFKGEVEYMLRCWGEEIQNDPAYNPNLSLNTETWTLAWPPRV